MNIKNLFKKTNWKLVKIIKLTVNHRNKSGNFYYRLYESNKGDRKMEYGCDLSSVNEEGAKDYAYRSPQYLEVIKRWLDGRSDPEILTYSQVVDEDVMNALKGKVEI